MGLYGSTVLRFCNAQLDTILHSRLRVPGWCIACHACLFFVICWYSLHLTMRDAQAELTWVTG